MSQDYGGATAEAPSVDLSERAAALKVVQDLVAARSPTQRDADRRLFLNGLDGTAERADFEKHGWMSPLKAAAIRAFWEDLSPDAFAVD